MSKLREHIRIWKTGRRQAGYESSLFSIKEEYNSYRKPTLEEYRVEVAVGDSFVATPENKESLQYAKEETENAIIEFVFGEFRQDINEVRSALLKRDFERAMEGLSNLQNKMYN